MVELCRAWHTAATVRERNRVIGELWFLVNAAIARYVRLHSRAYGFIDAEDVRDIASEKTLVFLHALEKEHPDASANPARTCSYISVMARNGLIDALRKRGRERAFARAADGGSGRIATPADSAEVHVQHDEFLAAMRACVMQMTERARNVWFMRAFMDMPSRRIADHPDVRMTPTAVNMMLVRVRRALRECLSRKGFSPDDVAPGTFVALWQLLRRGGEEEREGE